jgi:hypothetical protein
LEIRLSDAAHFPPTTPRKRPKRKSLHLEKRIQQAKLVAFDLGMAVVFFVTLYKVVMHEIGR